MQLLLALVLIHETRTVGGLSIDVGGGAVAVAVTADIVEDSALHNVAVGWIAEALQEGGVSYLDVTAWSWYDSATATVDVTSAWSEVQSPGLYRLAYFKLLDVNNNAMLYCSSAVEYDSLGSCESYDDDHAMLNECCEPGTYDDDDHNTTVRFVDLSAGRVQSPGFIRSGQTPPKQVTSR